MAEYGHQPIEQGFCRHFEAEHLDGSLMSGLQGCIDEIECQGCFAHRRASAEDDQIGFLKPGRQFVQIAQPRGHPGNGDVAIEVFVDLINNAHQALVDVDEL